MKVTLLFAMFYVLNADSLGFNRQRSIAHGHLARRLAKRGHADSVKLQILLHIGAKELKTQNDIELMKRLINKTETKKPSVSPHYAKHKFSIMHQLYTS